VDCVEKPAACDRVALCVARDLWSEAAQGIGRILGKYTLADMVLRQKAKRENVATDNYTI